jgi:tripartite motif-containing protein 71
MSTLPLSLTKAKVRPIRATGKRIDLFYLLEFFLLFDLAHLVMAYLHPIVDLENIKPKFIYKYTGTGKFNFGNLFGICFATVDNQDFIIACESTQNAVHILENNGTYVRSFGTRGSSGSGNNELNWPYCVTFDPVSQCVFITDCHNYRIQVFKLIDGCYVRTIGEGRYGFINSQLSIPRGIAINVFQRLVYVVDEGNNSIFVFTTEGKFVRKFGSHGTNNGQFANPRGIAIDQTTGNLYISDCSNHRIQVFSGEGTFIRMLGGPFYGNGFGEFRCPEGVAVNVDHNILLVSDFSNDRVQIFALDTLKFVSQIGTTRSFGFVEDGRFNRPDGVAFDPKSASVYVSEYVGSRIQVFSLE